ncbi:PDGLE domain-containing protein [Geobacter pelophilus]|uniref:PDGLE domain-containing protein n=1 Tax=Geoanaerobacter pelophilus TaxID=60036 RepID=A0AAW4L6W1_9BACT|nr:energy-coupling factor ABC transporter permease [Geoanaerobacter pelophilus]MBT0663996.1 PDGLE domain-containing protein [Geoanaerobacter pelophilus]
MHMADALISPAVGGTLWAASAGAIAYCSAKVKKEMDHSKIPLMGVLGAFIFAAQMINFTIPATGSSGHLGGGLILAILLGPHAAFLTIASVLVVQALFFADGGLLALGCNIFNLGFFPAFIAYPLFYRPLVGDRPTQGKIAAASLISAVVGLQLGALGVVLETVFSGISSLPFSTFIMLMQPIHLGIGAVEGVVSAAVVSFVYRAKPEIVSGMQPLNISSGMPMRIIVLVFFAVALFTGGMISWFASENPDGLEWSIKKVTGKEELEAEKNGIHGSLSSLQEKLAIFPGYALKKPEAAITKDARQTGQTATPASKEKREEEGKLGTSVSGIVGGLLTLGLVFVIATVLKKLAR